MRTTPWARRAAATVAALAVTVALPLPTAAAAGDAEGIPPYRTAGEGIKGTASSGRAPTLKPGTFTDSIGVGEKKYYGVDLDSVSGVLISAVVLPKPGTKVAYAEGVSVDLESPSGDDCSTGKDITFRDENAARPIADYVSRRIDRDLPCQEAGHYLFSIERDAEEPSDRKPWQVEIRLMVEPPLKRGAIPEKLLPAPSSTPVPPTGEARKATGGTGFNDAAPVDTGVWRDRILPGQALFYRVPVDWGQRLFATAEFANAAQVTEDGSYTYSGVRLEMYNPARGRLKDGTGSYRGEQTAVDLLSERVDYTNRYESGDNALQHMRFAGWHYLAVSMHSDVGRFTDGPIDVTLRLRVDGQAVKGPQYDGDAAAAGFGVSEDAFTREGTSGGKNLLAWGAFGTGGALLLGLALWMVLARRRSGASRAASGAAMGPGYGTAGAGAAAGFGPVGSAPGTAPAAGPADAMDPGNPYGQTPGQAAPGGYGQRPPGTGMSPHGGNW